MKLWTVIKPLNPWDINDHVSIHREVLNISSISSSSLFPSSETWRLTYCVTEARCLQLLVVISHNTISCPGLTHAEKAGLLLLSAYG